MNSLTVNNRVPQQRGTPLHGFPSFWYEGMVSGSNASCNHRNAGSTVGDTVCICLTAGSGTGGGDASMLFAGSRKPSALSTCEKGIPKSALAHYGNLRESSLSVKRQQCINPQKAARQTRKNSAPKGAVACYTKRICNFLPVALANFFSVANDGPLCPEARLPSMRVIAVAFVPIRSATCAWVNPAFLRAASISSSSANSSSIASYSAFTAGFDSILLTISSCVIRLPVTLYLLHSVFSFFEFGWRSFLRFLHEAVQHNDTPARQRAVKDTSNAFCTLEANFEQTVTECFSMRGSKIRTIDTHFLRVPNVSGLQSIRQRKDLGFNFFAVVLNSVVHDSKHNKIVMFAQALDHMISGSYTVPSPHKTGVGRENPESITAHNRAFAVFLCVKHCHIRIMVGRAGQPQGWPVSVVAGFSPLYVSPPMIVRSLGGELSKLTIEAAIMATIPTLDHPEFSREDITLLKHADHLNIILDTMQYLSTRSSAEARVQLVRMLLVAREHGQKLREELFRIEKNTTLTPSTPARIRGQK